MLCLWVIQQDPGVCQYEHTYDIHLLDTNYMVLRMKKELWTVIMSENILM